MTKLTYTDLCGNTIEVDSLQWLEDGRYYDEEAEEWCDCARYCINAEEVDADSESVWLNYDLNEVDPDDYPDDEEEDEDDQGGDE